MENLEPPAHWEALADIESEVLAQNEKWGEQYHVNGLLRVLAVIIPHPIMRGILEQQRVDIEPLLDKFQRLNDGDQDQATWTNILLEEVFEAMLTDNDEDLYTELKQVAAVCANWMTDITSRRKTPRDH